MKAGPASENLNKWTTQNINHYRIINKIYMYSAWQSVHSLGRYCTLYEYTVQVMNGNVV